MRAARYGALRRLGAVMIGVAVGSCASSSGSSGDRNEEFAAADQSRKTQQELQSDLMAFADRYFALSLESAKTIERALQTPESRYTAAAARFVGLMVTTDIASSPNPGAAVLDMAVFVTLRRMVWEDYWMPEVYGEAGHPVLDVLVELEEDIWSIAATVYTSEQLSELKVLIDNWRARHPDATAVDFMRLTELGDARQVQALVDAGRPGGMLAPVKEANRNIEEMRMLGERLTFMASRMQLMLSLQLEMASAKIVIQPEVRQLLVDSQSFVDASDRFAEAFATLVADLPHERQAAVDHLLDGLAQERKSLLADLAADDSDLNTVLGEVREIVELTRQLGEILNETMINTDRLVERMLSEEPARPFDIMDYHATIAEATTTVREFQTVLEQIERLLGSPDIEGELDPILEGANRFEEEVVDPVIDRAFLRGVALIVIFFVVLACYRLLMRRLLREPHSQPGSER